MANLLKLDGTLVADTFTLVQTADDALPAGDIIVPLAVWQAQKATLIAREGKVGVWLAPEQSANDVKDDLGELAVVAMHLPIFSDGRGYSTARLLAERFGYQGEIRAFGDVLIDQVYYLSRVGFNSLELRADQIVENAIKALSTFSEDYQTSANQPTPLFRRRA